MKLNRDEAGFNQTSARGDPTILKPEAPTDLLIMDGHGAVIGGIFSRNTGADSKRAVFGIDVAKSEVAVALGGDDGDAVVAVQLASGVVRTNVAM